MSESSLDTILKSLAPSTVKQYDVALKLWWSFCNERKLNPYSGDINQVITFLQLRLDSQKKLSYGSINSYRSALSLILQPETMLDPVLKRFLRGVFRLRPPRRKYSFTWDPSIVLNYLENLPKNEELSLRLLSRKLATLLALISAHRLQTLARIRVKDIVVSSDGIQIAIADLIKTSSPRSMQPILHIPFFTEKPALCAASTLLQYIERTANLRSNEQDYLFLSTRKPFLTASTQTISKWIRLTPYKKRV